MTPIIYFWLSSWVNVFIVWVLCHLQLPHKWESNKNVVASFQSPSIWRCVHIQCYMNKPLCSYSMLHEQTTTLSSMPLEILYPKLPTFIGLLLSLLPLHCIRLLTLLYSTSISFVLFIGLPIVFNFVYGGPSSHLLFHLWSSRTCANVRFVGKFVPIFCKNHFCSFSKDLVLF